MTELASISARLRKEREFSFYGNIDFIPTDAYPQGDAERALNDARRVVEVLSGAITSP